MHIIQAFLVSEIDGGEWSASRHSRFAFKENVYITTGIGEFWGCTVGWGYIKNKKCFSFFCESNCSSSVVEPAA